MRRCIPPRGRGIVHGRDRFDRPGAKGHIMINDKNSAAPTTATFGVTGMTCEHCVASVTEEVRHIAGVKGVDVELVPGGVSTVTVQSADALSDDAISAAIDEAGYELAPLPR
jgi:copper chaperone